MGQVIGFSIRKQTYPNLLWFQNEITSRWVSGPQFFYSKPKFQFQFEIEIPTIFTISCANSFIPFSTYFYLSILIPLPVFINLFNCDYPMPQYTASVLYGMLGPSGSASSNNICYSVICNHLDLIWRNKTPSNLLIIFTSQHEIKEGKKELLCVVCSRRGPRSHASRCSSRHMRMRVV